MMNKTDKRASEHSKPMEGKQQGGKASAAQRKEFQETVERLLNDTVSKLLPQLADRQQMEELKQIKDNPLTDQLKETQATMERAFSGDGFKEGVDAFWSFAQNMLGDKSLEIDEKQMNTQYAHAQRLYDSGQYEEAFSIFATLALSDPQEPRYIMGIAACQHMQKRYKEAASGYMTCHTLDPTNPIPCYHAADCYMHLKDDYSTLVCFKLVIKVSGGDPQYSVIKDRAKLAITDLEKKLKNGGQEEHSYATEQNVHEVDNDEQGGHR